MASESKGERAEGTLEGAAGIRGASFSDERATESGDFAAGSYEPADSASRQDDSQDDEDVSLDELMMSDSSDEDEEATEVHDLPTHEVVEALRAPIVTAPEPGDTADRADTSGDDTEAPEEEAVQTSRITAQPSVHAAPDDGSDEVLQAEALQALYSQGRATAVASLDDEEPVLTAASPETGSGDDVTSDPAASDEFASDSAGLEDLAAAPSAVEAAPVDQGASLVDAAGELTDEPETPEAIDATRVEVGARVATLPGVSDALDDMDETEPPRPVAPRGSASRPANPTPPSGTRQDAPLPSFDIPDLGGAVAARAEPRVRTGTRPVVPLSPLSEVAEEDDDDAVTHIGLPVAPEAANDYPQLDLEGFQVAEAGVAALQAFDPELNLKDARRATTRVIARVAPERIAAQQAPTIPPKAQRAPSVTLETVSLWFSSLFTRLRDKLPPPSDAPSVRRTWSWWGDNVLPPVSYILIGSGIGAGIMLLQPDPGGAGAQPVQAVHALKDGAREAKRPVTLVERAEAGEGEALFKITNMPAAERTSALTLAWEAGYRAQRLNEYEELEKALQAPNGASDPTQLSRFVEYATSPETMLPALRDLSGWTGSRGPDVLYAIWEKAPVGSRAAILAQQLLQAPDQRAKATPALAAALDLRVAASCDDYLRLMPSVSRDGDQRCSATLRSLKHTDGCGSNGEQDCYACLREGAMLDDTLRAIESRTPPQL